ncbi:hypothetical protein FRC0263_00532 [Corynebacterium diphtheriae]|nr:hypothetical protein CIP107555_00269 [Corynebacterium diphtheriae]CAB0789575.1 hypothetical protein FRC0263_00532 [Corynebacterium diphtheriae]
MGSAVDQKPARGYDRLTAYGHNLLLVVTSHIVLW